MSEIDYVAQPAMRSALEVLENIASSGGVQSLDVAAAYITAGGLHDFVDRMETALGGDWPSVEKRWLTSFDYCRTQPVALEKLLSLPTSSVRVHDAHFTLAHNAMPKIPFHPKTFLIRSDDKDFALAGSGNLSRSGMSRGVEVGLALSVLRTNPAEASSAASMQSLRDWYLATWNNATPLNPALIKRYTALFESQDNLKNPTVTEDDLASDENANGALSSKDLQKLRICKNFWIESGNITKNRGPKLPGNQLMMKRMSRVFFGFFPNSVPVDTLIGSVGLYFGGNPIEQYSLSYSNNKMDKLNLPMPAILGPVEYDNSDLLFEQVGPQIFRLSLGTAKDKAGWRKRSNAISASFKMRSGREWGVF